MGGRPEPLTRTVEERLMQFTVAYTKAIADGAIDRFESDVLIGIAVGMVPAVTELVMSMDFIGTVCNGTHGIFSPYAERGWNEAHRSRSNVVAFPQLHGGTGNQQSGD